MPKFSVTFCDSKIIESGKYDLPLAKQSFVRTTTVEVADSSELINAIPEGSYLIDCVRVA